MVGELIFNRQLAQVAVSSETLWTGIENYPIGVDVRPKDLNVERRNSHFQKTEVQLFQG